MPVNFEEYDAPDDSATRHDIDWGFDPATNAYTRAILSFLSQDPEIGYTAKEIHEVTGIARGSIRTALRALRERDFVRQKGPYWSLHRRGITAYQELLESVDR